LNVLDWTGPVDGGARRRLFEGSVLRFDGHEALDALVALLRRRIDQAMGGAAPPDAENLLTPESFLERAQAAIAACEGAPSLRDALRAAPEAVGVDVKRTFWDRLRLRVQTSNPAYSAGRTMTLPAHRDTWGSNMMAQINWWMPVYPVTAGRTVAIHTEHFTRPIANTSDTWSFEALKARRSTGDTTYPNLPVATESPDPTMAHPIVVDPGTLVAFSSAHLHASVPNRTGLVRYSIGVRTVDIDDVRQGLGAPNVDGHARGVRTEWFRRVTDRLPLPAALANP